MGKLWDTPESAQMPRDAALCRLQCRWQRENGSLQSKYIWESNAEGKGPRYMEGLSVPVLQSRDPRYLSSFWCLLCLKHSVQT